MISKFIERIQGVRSFLILINDPTQTDKVFKLTRSDRFQNDPLFKAVIDGLSADRDFQIMYESGYNPPLPPIADLAKYPEGTFGRAFADHIVQNKLAVDFYPVDKKINFNTYVVARSRKLHDMWHVLTGFDTSLEGEMGVQGFSLAQLRSPLSANLIAAGLLHCTIKNPAAFERSVKNIFLGYQLGKACKTLITLRLEDHLARDLRELRQELGLSAASLAAS